MTFNPQINNIVTQKKKSFMITDGKAHSLNTWSVKVFRPVW